MSETAVKTAGGSRRLVVPTVLLTMLVGGLFLSTFQFSLYAMSEEYRFGSTVMGLVTSVQFAFMILFTIPLGRLADKIGNKRVYLLQSASTAAGCLLLWSRLGGLPGVLLGAFFGGAGYGILALVSTTVLTEAFPLNAGRYVSLGCVGFSAGALLGPVCARAIIAGGAHWSLPFLYIAAGGALCIVMILLTQFYKGEGISAPQQAEGGGLKLIFSNPALVLLGLGIILYLGIETCTASFMEAYFQNTVGGGALSALALSLFWGLMFPSRMFISAYKGTKYPLILGCIVLAVGLLAAVSLLPVQLGKTVLFALLGLVLGPIYPIMMGTGSSSLPGHTGMVTGFLSTCFGIGAGLIPPVIGRLIALCGYPWAMVFLAGLAAVLFAVYLSAVRVMKRSGRTQGI